MIPLIYFQKHIIMMTGLKIKKMTDTTRKSDKEEQIDITTKSDK